jgi:uncharacterized protein (DUF302 family)
MQGKSFLRNVLGPAGLEMSLNVVPLGQGIPFLHKHRQNKEVYVIVDGRGEFLVDDECIDVAEGSVLPISPAAARAWRNKGAKAKIEAMAGPSGFMLFATHNHGALLRLAGQQRKAIQYIVGNPLFAFQMTQHDIRASLYAPLRVLIYENDEGKTCVEYDKPSSLFGQFGNDRISPTAAMLDKKLEALVAAAME